MRLLIDEQLSARLCEDFHRLSVLRGGPPKVIWLRQGNASTEEVARLLRERREDVLLFVSQAEATFLALGG